MSLSTLQVRGPFKGPSGYDHHVREFVRELVKQGVEVQLMDVPRWGATRLPAHLCDPWFETLDRPVDARVSLQFCMPHQVLSLQGFAIVNYTMFEATRISPAWVNASHHHDMIILPTESSRRAWLNSGVPDHKLRLCPLGVDPRRFSGDVEPLPLWDVKGEALARYRVRFLNISEISPRKNLVGLIRAWLRGTSRHDDAVLILKLGSYSPGWREIFDLQIEHLQHTLGKRIEDAAPIHIIHDLFSDESMPRLYTAATHYISMSHGEGWDQPMVEAAASGLTLIAPDHSAYATYLDRSCAHLLPATEELATFPVASGFDAFFENACWWIPDEDAAAALIRSIVGGTAPEKTSPRDRIATELNWQIATLRLITLLREAETRRPRRFWRLPPLYKRV